MATKPTTKKATASTEVVLGAAAQQIAKAVTELGAATATITKLSAQADDLTLQVANKEDAIAALEVEYKERERQLGVDLDLSIKSNTERVVTEYLGSVSKTSIAVAELNGLRQELAETKANADAQTKKEVVLPNPHSILYWIDPSNPTGPAPADPTKNSQYSRWEAEFQQYIGQHSGIIPQASTEPVGTDDVHTVANEPQVALTSPTQTIAISSTDPVTLQTTITSPANYPITKVDYYLNGQFIGTSTNITSYTFDPTDSNVTTGVNQLKIIATDSVYNQGELDTTIKFK